MSGNWCDACGTPRDDGDHARCEERRRASDPPRFCVACGRKLVVQVLPRGWRARCVKCGPLHPATTGAAEQLAQLRADGLYRQRRPIASPTGPRVQLDGREVLLMCSNDYLGLADHPAVRGAAARAALQWGAGAGSSALVSGYLEPQRRLERALADFKGTQACVLFGSGFLANTGVIAALAGPDDVILSDALNHASLIDGCRLARARTVVYPHLDVDALAHELKRVPRGKGVIVTDAVFSMDGDVAPLTEIAALAESHGARVVVDEAHATGVCGPGGRGLVAELGLEQRVDVIVGTLGKALGSYGAFACCDQTTADLLVNRARTMIFSTALPPAAIGAAQRALDLVCDQPSIVERGRTRALELRRALAEQGLPVDPVAMPIVPLVVGRPEDALIASEAALREGLFVQAIRPPTVPDGTSRLRVVATAAHSRADVMRAAAILAAALDEAKTSEDPSDPRENPCEPERHPPRSPGSHGQFARIEAAR